MDSHRKWGGKSLETLEMKAIQKTTGQLERLSRIQALLVAVCSMERLWMLFEHWTEQESALYLQLKPERFREPARALLDSIWQQVWAEQEAGEYQEQYHQFHELVEESFEECDGQDVDFGDARLLLDALDYSWVFLKPARATTSHLSALIHLYSYSLYDYLLEEFCEQHSVKRIGPEQQALAAEYIAQHPLWCQAIAHIEADIAAASTYPSNKELFCERKKQYSSMLLPSLLRPVLE